ncbi:CHAT domain-containing protein, partial [Mycena capillaripes]
LANSLQTRFDLLGDQKDLDEAVEILQQKLALSVPSHPTHGTSLNNLAVAVFKRFKLYGDSKDIDQAIKLLGEVLEIYDPLHPERAPFLTNLGAAFQLRFLERGQSEDINTAVKLHREALALCAPTHPDYPSSLFALATALQEKFDHQGDANDIDEAIEQHTEVLAFYPFPHPQRDGSLNNLGLAIYNRFKQRGDPNDINKAVELHREALALRQPPHQDHTSSLTNLALAVQARFKQQENSHDIDEAIELCRESLSLCHPSHVHCWTSLNSLTVALRTRFEKQGDAKDINEAIELGREALVLRAWPHPDHGRSLNNLAIAMQTRFERQGDLRDIDKAIELHRQALSVWKLSHPSYSASLNNLAAAVQTRYEQEGDPKDIDEAIDLHRKALSLPPSTHMDHSMSLNNLANALQMRFEQWGDSNDIEEAIRLHKEALTLCPQSHADHPQYLNNLALAMRTRFKWKGHLKDINDSVELHRQALSLCSPTHPDRGRYLLNLAAVVETRFEQKNDPKDSDEAIELYSEALALLPSPSRDHDQAATYPSSPPLVQFRHAYSWAKMAMKHSHVSSLTAYRTAIELLPQLAGLHLDVHSRQEVLSNITGFGINLASEAASCAVMLGQYNTAVEFLDAGCSVFWSQALNLRPSLEGLAVVRPDLSEKLTEISRQLEQISFRNTSRNTFTDTHDKIISMEFTGRRSRQLNDDWEQILKSIRMLPEFKDFMQPKRISGLQQAAISGPIVILTTSHSACHALIVTLNNEVQCIKLPNLTLHLVMTLAKISRALSNSDLNSDIFMPQARSELLGRLFGQREGSHEMNSDDLFQLLLGYLWENVVKPVFDFLKLKARNPLLGPFAFLPIHAAGSYSADDTDCVSDYVVSSYTPTITALLNPPVQTTALFAMTTVIQPQAPDCRPLPGARTELAKIRTRVPNQWLRALGDTTPATVETALVHLRQSSIVHFACHGVQDLKEPLDSGLILTDGRLRVSEIMRRPEGDHILDTKKFMSLAFLSACETAKGDEAVSDEAMHLAATLLFSGFRGVVATMWTMNDLDGPKIADTFYGHLFKDCDPNFNPPNPPDLTQAAKALHLAVQKLRKEPDISFHRWVPYVHYG